MYAFFHRNNENYDLVNYTRNSMYLNSHQKQKQKNEKKKHQGMEKMASSSSTVVINITVG